MHVSVADQSVYPRLQSVRLIEPRVQSAARKGKFRVRIAATPASEQLPFGTEVPEKEPGERADKSIQIIIEVRRYLSMSPGVFDARFEPRRPFENGAGNIAIAVAAW